MNINRPLVSCLCITENRTSKLKQVIDCFTSQSYDQKELVVLHNAADVKTYEYLSELADPRISFYSITERERYTLGHLRNLSIEKARGEYFCQWDDDDWYHMDRLQQQVDAAISCGKPGSILMHLIFFNTQTKEAFFSFSRPWENSILCSKQSYLNGIKYPAMNQQEDTTFVSELIFNNQLTAVTSFPTYIYNYHGTNTCSQNHFNQLFIRSQKLSPESSKIIADIVENRGAVDGSRYLVQSGVLEELDFFFHLWQS